MKILSFILIASLLACGQANTSPIAENKDPQKSAKINRENLSVATFAGGCFWCTEAVFERVKGVEDVVSGYAGGEKNNPTYEEVSRGRTKYAEAVQIYYNSEVITFKELFEIFMGTHYPTQVDGQGPDHGKQYRSAAYYRTQEEEKIIRSYIEELSKSEKYNDPIVTEVAPFTTFYEAEDYHQNYYEIHPDQSYIMSIAVPKVEKFKKNYSEWVKEQYK